MSSAEASSRGCRAGSRHSMPSCPAVAGRARRSPSCCCRIPASARSGCSAAASRPSSRPAGRSMLFDPPAALSAWALADLGLDVEQLLVIDARARVVPGSDSLWALEQALKSGQVGAVLAWLAPRLRAERLRRLQLAAHRHDGPHSCCASSPPPTARRHRRCGWRCGRAAPMRSRRASSSAAVHRWRPGSSWRCRRCSRVRRASARTTRRRPGVARCIRPPSSTSRPTSPRERSSPSPDRAVVALPCSGSPCTCRCSRSRRSRRRCRRPQASPLHSRCRSPSWMRSASSPSTRRRRRSASSPA